MKIEKVDLYRLKIPLKRPYKIATAEMTDFDMTLVGLHAGGREGIGEAMSGIEGYFWETPEEVWQFAKENGPKVLGLDVSRAKAHLAQYRAKNPCAITPLVTAMEMAEGNPVLHPPGQPCGVPVVGILQAIDPTEIEDEVGKFLAAGYDTIKIKVGFDAEKDVAKVKTAQKAIQGKALIRIDANQGYEFSQAKKFVLGIDPQGIEFFEQPFREKEWDAMVELSKISPVPLGLDESIYGMESVEKARRLKCCRFVKFKLMKIGSAQLLAENIATCRKYGFGVILGNGAAGEINCYLEALIARQTIDRAAEMNGFLKQTESVLQEPIPTDGGKILLSSQYVLKLDPRKVDRYAVERVGLH
jgi:L-Ala-D/L-Glu epimerase